MKDLLKKIQEWKSINKKFAIATVTKTWGSSPRPIGSSMIISEDMEMAGSVSGGCVEGAVVKSALLLLKNGEGKQLSFGVTNDEAWEVGLSCGGKIDVYVEPFLGTDEKEELIWKKLEDCLENNQGCILMTRLEDGKGQHALILPDGKMIGSNINTLTTALKEEGLRAFQERKNQIVEVEKVKYFAQVFPRKNQMLIIGAAHITVDLVQLAKMYNFQTIVIDPRGIFTNKTQFNIQPDFIFEKYPSEILYQFKLDTYTYAIVLSHDPKIDDNALEILLRSEIGYIGALGSRKTHAKRVSRLLEKGFSEEEIEKIHSPIGMDIKAKTPKEIALSIMGEVIQVKNEFL
ncbi:MAG: XdhC family protein [Saprospiraceae bacterium]